MTNTVKACIYAIILCWVILAGANYALIRKVRSLEQRKPEPCNTVIVHDDTIEGPLPTWDGHSWRCQAGYDIWASESEALDGRPFVHCVR